MVFYDMEENSTCQYPEKNPVIATVLDQASSSDVICRNDGLTPDVKSSMYTNETPVMLFKKPSFIGPKKVIKSLPKKSLKQSNEGFGENDANNDVSKDSKPASDVKQNSKNFPPLPYDVPMWKGFPTDNYKLEELKAGAVLSITELKGNSFFVFGRIDCCDVVMAHPTISRYHAVLQFRGVPDGELDKGFYIYDLESTHGTFLNGAKLKPKVYARVKVGHIIRFGCSTRFFLLQGPEYDQEEESELTFTELKEKRRLELQERRKKAEEQLLLAEASKEEERRKIEERGISWGLGEDADEEDDLSENPYAVMTNEELYSDDPKKALKQWFEREGEDLVFQCELVDKGLMACKIVLPLDDEHGQEIMIETSARSKKEAQVQCALEACRTIDKMGLFRQTKQEAKKRQTRNWEENDYYDSDEDSFLDRTGDLDKKRQKRMKKVGKVQETVETYESLMVKHSGVLKELSEAEARLGQLLLASQTKSTVDNSEIDELDAFMENLKNNKPGKLDIKRAKDEISYLKREEEHLRKLINIAKPTTLPELRNPVQSLPKKTATQNEKIQEKLVPSTVKKDSHNKGIKESDSSNQQPMVKNCSSSPKVNIPPISRKAIGAGLPDEINRNNYENQSSLILSSRAKTKPTKFAQKEETMEEDYTNLVWQPPKGQTGDGRTSLNDKYGY